jgi:hypothetical protein
MKKVAIVQSNYIPWKGYFDMIAAVDEFILYDDMQYTRRDWRNRNQIKTPQGVQWITVPVLVKGKYEQAIRDTKIDGASWAGLHWKSIEQNYKRAKYFEEIATWLRPVYLERHYDSISELNRTLIERICGYLGITTQIKNSWDYELTQGRSERLADLCLQAEGTTYVSGPAAKDYMDERVFAERGIRIDWFDYSNYREYPQLWGEFVHVVSIIDLMLNCGPESAQYMRHVSP